MLIKALSTINHGHGNKEYYIAKIIFKVHPI